MIDNARQEQYLATLSATCIVITSNIPARPPKVTTTRHPEELLLRLSLRTDERNREITVDKNDMEPTLHLKQGLTLLEKVLKFYPMMQEGDKAEVALTQQDWLVLMDFIENPESKELIPEKVQNMRVAIDDRKIHITTDDCEVDVEMGM